MAEELAHWIAGSGQRATDPAALQATTLFAGAPATMRLAQGHGGLPPPGRALKTGRKTAEDLGQELRRGSEGRRPGCGAAR